MLKLSLITLVISSICILGGGFGNVANAQACYNYKTISGFDVHSEFYNACDHWMKATFQCELSTSGTEEGVYMFAGTQNEYVGHEYYAYQYDFECQTIVDQTWKYCNDLTDHQLVIETFVDVPGDPKDCLFANPVIIVHYYAEQMD